MSTTHVDERLEATRRRWQEEVRQAEARLETAKINENLAGQTVLETDRDSDLWDRAVADHFRAIDMRHAAKAALDRIASDHELARRLENSEKLARRFA